MADQPKPAPAVDAAEIDPADYHEGPKAARRFEELFGSVMATSRRVIEKRQAAYEERKRRSTRRKG